MIKSKKIKNKKKSLNKNKKDKDKEDISNKNDDEKNEYNENNEITFNKKMKKDKNKNKEAVEFVLANRDKDDPNFNNPNANKKILLQVNKNEDLTDNQKKIIDSIPAIDRGIFDDNAKIKLMTQKPEDDNINEINENNNNNKSKKGVNFDLDKNEIINFDKKQKVGEIQHERLLNDIKNKKIDITKIEDDEKLKEIKILIKK